MYGKMGKALSTKGNLSCPKEEEINGIKAMLRSTSYLMLTVTNFFLYIYNCQHRTECTCS